MLPYSRMVAQEFYKLLLSHLGGRKKDFVSENLEFYWPWPCLAAEATKNPEKYGFNDKKNGIRLIIFRQ